MDDETDLRKYLDVLVRRKRVVLATFLSVLLVGTILSFLAPRVYEASVLLFPGTFIYVSPSFPSPTISPPNPLAASQGRFTINLYGYPRVLTEILQSDAFVREIVERLGLDAATLRVRAQGVPDSFLVRLTVRAGTPGTAQRVSEALASSLVQKSDESTGPLRQVLERLLEQTRADAPVIARVAAEARKFSSTSLRGNPTAEELRTKALILEALTSADRTYQTVLDRERILTYQIAEVQPVRVIGGSRAVEVQVAPHKLVNVTVAGVLGLLAGALAAFATESLVAPARTPTASSPGVRT